MSSETVPSSNQEDDSTDVSRRNSSASGSSTPYSFNTSSGNASPYYMSPFNQPSPYSKSPWITHQYPSLESFEEGSDNLPRIGLIGSLFRTEGHIYALATSGNLLYTGSESKNIRVWKNLEEFSGFKSNSGLVKAIVVVKEKIFTGHQDGKIRVWKSSGFKRKSYKRVGSLPTSMDYLTSAVNPNNYVQVRRHKNVPWNKHFDTISCMAVDLDQGFLYSSSWDKTLKVWRLSDSKCIESINAHDDAVNSVVVGFQGMVFTGSADGKVKAWRREVVGKHMEHVLVSLLLEQEAAVTSLAVSVTSGTVYAGSSDGLVNFWDGEKGFISPAGVLRGHKSAVLCLAAGGRLVMSGSADNSICVWTREKESGPHTFLSVLTGHGGPVKCLAVEQELPEEESPPAERDQTWFLYSGSLDKSVKVWRISETIPDST